MLARPLLLACCAALALLCGPLLEDPPAEELLRAVRQHMQVVRDRRLSLEERRAAVEALLELPPEGPRQLAERLGQEASELGARLGKLRGSLERDFEKRARRALAKRLDRAVWKEVEELRGRLAERAGDEGLTKERIVAECDPAVARLAALLLLDARALVEGEPELRAQLDALLTGYLDERTLGAWIESAHERLGQSPEGRKIAERLVRPPISPDAEAALWSELEFRALLATTMPDADGRALVESRALAAELDPEEAAGNLALARLRILCGLRVDRTDLRLSAAARDHSRDMREHGFFSHDSPLPGKRSFAERAALAGTSASSENIARGQRSGPAAIESWWYSPGHHRNMLGSHARVGLGRSEDHWTQLFGG